MTTWFQEMLAHLKTNISLFPADIHTYKLTFVSFFFMFFVHLLLMKKEKGYLATLMSFLLNIAVNTNRLPVTPAVVEIWLMF